MRSIAFPKLPLQPAASVLVLLCLICLHVFTSQMELALYFQGHAPVQLLSSGSGSGTVRKKSAAESHGASLASLHDLLVNSAYGVGVAPPHALR